MFEPKPYATLFETLVPSLRAMTSVRTAQSIGMRPAAAHSVQCVCGLPMPNVFDPKWDHRALRMGGSECRHGCVSS